MTRNPYLNAFAAAAYIVALVSLIFFALPKNGPDNSILIPISMLSLLVLSVLVMALCFFYRPALLFGAGQVQAAVHFFITSAVTFAIIVILIVATMFVYLRFNPPVGVTNDPIPVTSSSPAIQ